MNTEKKELTDNTIAQFKNDVADLYVMLEGVTEELRAFRGDERTTKIVAGSLELLKAFGQKYASKYMELKKV
jgi:hypothetical protein